MTPPDDPNGSGYFGMPSFLRPVEFPPPSATVQVTFGADSRRGPSRSVNEDHYIVLRLGRYQETLLTSLPDDAVASRFDEYGYAMVVADGIGGGAGAGETASHLALATLVYLVRHFGKWNLRVDDAIAREIMARAERFYRHVDSTLVYQRHKGAVRAAETTMTAIFGAGYDLFFAHVGHSRAYLCRDRRLMRLTRDHTIGRKATAPVRTAPLIDVNAAARDLKHVITNTIGMSGLVGPTIDLERVHLSDDDRVLVCTNGLTDAVDEPLIGEVLASDQPPDMQSRALVDLAMASGSADDVTALVGRYRFPQ